MNVTRLIRLSLFCSLATAAPAWSAGNLLDNGDFESAPFATGWQSSGITATAGLNGTATAARLPWSGMASLGQAVAPVADFTFDVYVQSAGSGEPQTFRVILDGASGAAIELRGGRDNRLQVNHDGGYFDVVPTDGGSPELFPVNSAVRLRVVGRDFGTPQAEWDLAWSEPGSSVLANALTGLRSFADPASALGGGLRGVRFDRNISNAAHSYTIDEVSLAVGVGVIPEPTHLLALDVAAVPDGPGKIARISGVYPHLTMSSGAGECGPGAIAEVAGDLWVVTYDPHSPGGSGAENLHQITPELERLIRPESVGGTPANRLYHEESGQWFIGHHVIGPAGMVRTIPTGELYGRLTGTARHLFEPESMVYFGTMEEGFYEVDVDSLAVNRLYADTNRSGSPRANLPGVHGKGLFTSNGLLYYTNNGGEGVLASWDGSGWTNEQVDNFTEVTGPGGVAGNLPGEDRLWALGWDDASVLLKLREGGTGSPWHDFRLPKGSYTHDAGPGWYTEWPRIRQLDPSDPGSPYLMHMHGMFFDFPGTFSSTDFGGLQPISSYHKMPVDYTLFNGELVMTKNDASKFSNNLAQRAQSNLWWGSFEELSTWGAPHGHGGVWLKEAVADGQVSDPFLVNEFTRITLHLREQGGVAVPVEIQTSDGDGSWTPLRTVPVGAGGYAFALLNDLGAEWVRLRAGAATSRLTAYFLLSNAYPHPTPASSGSDEFAAIADIRDPANYSGGVMRVMADETLRLEFASSRAGENGAAAAHRYHRIGTNLELYDIVNEGMEATLRSAAAAARGWNADAASVYLDDGGTRYRLPKLDSRYEAPFASGWARGFREVVTERELLNAHGTFYEIPRDGSGGIRRMKPITTHGKRISDYAAWRGLFAVSGISDSAPQTDTVVKNNDGTAALWLGEVDDIWRMGEPRGIGGPWLNTAISAGSASDPYLMYGYDRKVLELSHAADKPVVFTIEVDFLADGSWSEYEQFPVNPGQTVSHVFPEGFHAHWVRLVADTTTTATGQFAYGPVSVRDRFLDWARDHGLPTGGGRGMLADRDADKDGLSALQEFVFGTDPRRADGAPVATSPAGWAATLRQLHAQDRISLALEVSNDLQNWTVETERLQTESDPDAAPDGFIRYAVPFQPGGGSEFHRLTIALEGL
jgi:hypothetical protein